MPLIIKLLEMYLVASLKGKMVMGIIKKILSNRIVIGSIITVVATAFGATVSPELKIALINIGTAIVSAL